MFTRYYLWNLKNKKCIQLEKTYKYSQCINGINIRQTANTIGWFIHFMDYFWLEGFTVVLLFMFHSFRVCELIMSVVSVFSASIWVLWVPPTFPKNMQDCFFFNASCTVNECLFMCRIPCIWITSCLGTGFWSSSTWTRMKQSLNLALWMIFPLNNGLQFSIEFRCPSVSSDSLNKSHTGLAPSTL